MDDNTKDQLAYEEAVREVQKSVRAMREEGYDFSTKGARTVFSKKLVDLTKRVVKDKRIFK